MNLLGLSLSISFSYYVVESNISFMDYVPYTCCNSGQRDLSLGRLSVLDRGCLVKVRKFKIAGENNHVAVCFLVSKLVD
jgi:hypothetical protein